MNTENRITARPVKLSELALWIETNLHRTWHFSQWAKPGHLRQIKYLKPNIDTRDMKVWRIEIDGFYDVKDVSTHDEFDGNILQLLEKKLDEADAKGRARYEAEKAERPKASGSKH